MENNICINLLLNQEELLMYYNKILKELDVNIDICNTKNVLLNQIYNDTKKYPINKNNFNSNNSISIINNSNYKYITLNDRKEVLTFIGYPKNNLLLLLINNILLCIQNKKFIFEFYNLNSFESEITNNAVLNLNNIFNSKLTDKSELCLETFFNIIKEREILTLLGIRQTTGSLNNYLPPPIENIIEHFNKLHSQNNNKNKVSLLTVGARALSKHSYRSSDGFWPEDKGKEVQKNQNALNMLYKFLDTCIWINIHGLPHDLGIIEIRVNLGYGMRWEIAGEFRGFLEPQMKNGHENKWRH